MSRGYTPKPLRPLRVKAQRLRRLLMAHLSTADISDSAGAQAILGGIRKRWPWVKHVFANGACGQRLD